MYNNIELNRQDCNVLKGLAIICIFLHNYCHLLPNAPRENEYYWTIDNTYVFLTNITSNTFTSFFSFLGHYGVAIFVFLSGYGLVRKYGNLKTSAINDYVVNHYSKLFKLMFPGFVSYYAIYWLLYDDFDGINLFRIVSQILLVNNFIPTHISPIIPGPFWYFGLSMQFYLIFLFLCKTSLFKQWLFVICSLFLLLLSKNHHYMTVWLKYNFVGSLIPFILGVFVAKYNYARILYNDNIWLYTIIAFISFFYIIISELSFYTWIFSSIFYIFLCICIMKLLPSSLTQLLSSVGKISHIIFVIHPIIRLIVFYIQNSFISIWQIWVLIYVALVLGISLLFSYLTSLNYKK